MRKVYSEVDRVARSVSEQASDVPEWRSEKGVLPVQDPSDLPNVAALSDNDVSAAEVAVHEPVTPPEVFEGESLSSERGAERVSRARAKAVAYAFGAQAQVCERKRVRDGRAVPHDRPIDPGHAGAERH
jgi:hypothetical protein